jgi:hypothetical protein
MNKEVNGFSFAEKVGQSPIEKITKRLFEAQLNNFSWFLGSNKIVSKEYSALFYILSLKYF